MHQHLADTATEILTLSETIGELLERGRMSEASELIAKRGDAVARLSALAVAEQHELGDAVRLTLQFMSREAEILAQARDEVAALLNEQAQSLADRGEPEGARPTGCKRVTRWA